MSDKPPPYNPNLYDHPTPYPPPPPPYQQPYPQPYPQPYQQPYPPPTHGPTHVYATQQPGRSTTIITGSSYGTVTTDGSPIVVQAVPATSVLLVGGCPACRVGVLNDEFTLGGLCCAFWFFPIGLLCCLAMRDRRCTNCGATFST